MRESYEDVFKSISDRNGDFKYPWWICNWANFKYDPRYDFYCNGICSQTNKVKLQGVTCYEKDGKNECNACFGTKENSI